MPSFCLYGMCHNLGSSTYQGYCNESHMKRAWEKEAKETLAKLQESLSTIQKSTLTSTLRDGSLEANLTSSSRCAECTKPPHE
jgi:hypothetical protein